MNATMGGMPKESVVKYHNCVIKSTDFTTNDSPRTRGKCFLFVAGNYPNTWQILGWFFVVVVVFWCCCSCCCFGDEVFVWSGFVVVGFSSIGRGTVLG